MFKRSANIPNSTFAPEAPVIITTLPVKSKILLIRITFYAISDQVVISKSMGKNTYFHEIELTHNKCYPKGS